jgi:hypothetical protein
LTPEPSEAGGGRVPNVATTMEQQHRLGHRLCQVSGCVLARVNCGCGCGRVNAVEFSFLGKAVAKCVVQIRRRLRPPPPPPPLEFN